MSMNFKYKYRTFLPILVAVLLMPTSIVFAAPQNFKDLVYQIVDFINSGIVILFSLAVVYFFWSVVRNLLGSGEQNSEQKQKLQQTIIWGLIIIFVMVSIWGIIQILQNTLTSGI